MSESAVNQRIELVRARLGGIGRAELARLYRQGQQDSSLDAGYNSLTGQIIQLPNPRADGKTGVAESAFIPPPVPITGGIGRSDGGSQLSAHFPRPPVASIPRTSPRAGLGLAFMIVAIVLTALLLAAAITELTGAIPLG